jgi:asparagine synthase (glutamine-hydrolysing)
MCGICGVFYLEGDRSVDDVMVKKMARTMRHRGPDDEGFFMDGNIGLGHQRLSIIDLSPHGNQQMTNQDVS